MKSRYVAYKLILPNYIIETTHKNNIDFNTNTTQWKNDIINFCTNYNFLKLSILEFTEIDDESFVTFTANITSNGDDYTFTENSKFIKEINKWYYYSATF